jgi:hypothetical protein
MGALLLNLTCPRPLQAPSKEVWKQAEGSFIENSGKVPIPRSALVTGEIVVIKGQQFRLPSAAISSFKEQMVDPRRPDWKTWEGAYSITVPDASKCFAQAKRYAKEGKHGKALEIAATAFRLIEEAKLRQNRGARDEEDEDDDEEDEDEEAEDEEDEDSD